MSQNLVETALGRVRHTEHEALANFIEAMRVAEDQAKLLAHYQRNPAWLAVMNNLANVRAVSIKLAQRRGR